MQENPGRTRQQNNVTVSDILQTMFQQGKKERQLSKSVN